MTISFPKFSRRTTLAVFALVALTATVVFAIRPHAGDAHAAQGQPAGGRVEVELITLRPTGFDPAEITRPPGPFVLAIENRSGGDVGELRLTPGDDAPPGAPHLLEARVAKDQSSRAKRLNLPPGTYRLGQEGRPGWLCTIIVVRP